MSDEFNFDHIGKRLPYTLPPEAFGEMEANVFAALEQEKRSKKSYRIIRWSFVEGIAAAACVAVVLIVSSRRAQDDLLTQIDQAYANLSQPDQEFLMEICQEDIFLTQEQ